jgi:hypothetical protein
MLVIDYSHAEFGRVLRENCALVNIIFIIWILRFVVHPPIKSTLRGDISSIKYLRTTAVIVAPVGSVTQSNGYSFPSLPAVRGSMTVRAVTGHVSAMFTSCIYKPDIDF